VPSEENIGKFIHLAQRRIIGQQWSTKIYNPPERQAQIPPFKFDQLAPAKISSHFATALKGPGNIGSSKEEQKSSSISAPGRSSSISE